MLNLISLSITIALIVGAFAIHPVLGVIAVFSLIRVAV
jgi:hypothetical protein